MPAGMEGILNLGSVEVVIHKPIVGSDPQVLCSETRNMIADELNQQWEDIYCNKSSLISLAQYLILEHGLNKYKPEGINQLSLEFNFQLIQLLHFGL